MNYIDDTFQELKTLVKTQTDSTKLRPLIRAELKKLSPEQKSGLNKEELLNYLEKIFGPFQNGKYKGGKEVVIEVINELFGSANFKNGKFTGG